MADITVQQGETFTLSLNGDPVSLNPGEENTIQVTATVEDHPECTQTVNIVVYKCSTTPSDYEYTYYIDGAQQTGQLSSF